MFVFRAFTASLVVALLCFTEPLTPERPDVTSPSGRRRESVFGRHYPRSGAQPGSTGYEAQQPYNVPQDYSVQVNTGDSDQTYVGSRPQVTSTRPAQVKPGHDSSRALKPQRAAAGTPQSNVQIGRLVRESGRAVRTRREAVVFGVLGTPLW